MIIKGNWKAFLIEILIAVGSCLCRLLRTKTGDKYPDEDDF